eukprot:TRINITY_DN596_c4_g1_i1.p1 TRINITY_DN596_c4_g1~~TRINITY_DN596_c4_g1_i1.p1  ORF type:complete len:547 (-),score=150.07 TRINITY_DN596_c4_g1_i1:344-1984(-)
MSMMVSESPPLGNQSPRSVAMVTSPLTSPLCSGDEDTLQEGLQRAMIEGMARTGDAVGRKEVDAVTLLKRQRLTRQRSRSHCGTQYDAEGLERIARISLTSSASPTNSTSPSSAATSAAASTAASAPGVAATSPVTSMTVEGDEGAPFSPHAELSEPIPLRDPRTRPAHRLTACLIDTYQAINEVYTLRMEAKRALLEEQRSYDDEESNYLVSKDEVLDGRYQVLSLLGKGTFGQVVKAFDMLDNSLVAVKIVKSKTPYYRQGLKELAMLKKLNEVDSDDENYIVRLYDHFEHRHHLCLVFEHLSINLYELLRSTRYAGVSLNLIRKFGFQILTTLYFLSKENLNIIHCDLKPENILLVHPKRSALKVIDFGSACYADDKMYTYVQSRFYRAPEVMLGCKYTRAVDMWSLGCILVEMHTGKPLFRGMNEHDQITRIVAMLGLPPIEMMKRGTKTKQYFLRSKSCGFKPRKLKRPTKGDVPTSLSEVIGVKTGGPKGSRAGQPGHTLWDYLMFFELIQGCLALDPLQRLTPLEALNHSFFRQNPDMH